MGMNCYTVITVNYNAYEEICLREGADRASCDYISGMTDRFAVHKFEELFIPLSWS